MVLKQFYGDLAEITSAAYDISYHHRSRLHVVLSGIYEDKNSCKSLVKNLMGPAPNTVR